ncbi:MAG TPA: aldehyde ferredoxin oxidoreductase [Desulfobacterales bacterium]|nr:aldehyde ferredoxin oxidoreductase [Desulfobacterales bacterium]
MMYGYAGTILRVDLINAIVRKEPLSESLAENFIGGRGFVAKMLYDEISSGIGPYDPENMLIVAAGPLTGQFLPAGGKTHFGTKSPATGGYADSNMGGHFGPQLKYAGYDVLVITGKAERPSYLFVSDNSVEIRPAAEYWGQGAITSEKNLKNRLGDDYQIITIGPAGENRVRYACISHDFGRQAGRTGVGAVMGSKNLKAIAVKGTGSIPVADLKEAYAKGKEAYRKVKAKPGFKGWTPEGTAGITNWANEVGVFPTRNFQTSYAEHYKNINGKAILDRLKITDKGCFGCPTPCGKYGHTRTKLGSAYVEGPEYETIAMFGGNCALKTIEEVAYANYLCDELGIDTISAGVVIGWAIESFQKEILTQEDIGRKIDFSDLDTVVYLLNKIAHREGIGDLLAEGVKTAAENTGKGSERFAIHVKGLEWTGYECRNAPSMMLAYLTADVGAHHNRAWVLGHDIAGARTSVYDLIASEARDEAQPKAVVSKRCVDYVIESQHTRSLFDALGNCRLQMMELGFEEEHYAELYSLITGVAKSWEDLLKISERIWHLTRAFSVREINGFGRHFDFPPARLYEEPIADGPNKGHVLSKGDIHDLLTWYYTARGWNENGIPTKKTLLCAGLSEVAEDFTSRGLFPKD